jgi:two-component system, cell cycle sensor histidine kinase and response regulator CckA
VFFYNAKLRFKILFFLSVIFIFSFGISVTISTYVLMRNQHKNISTFKNEFVNSFTENAGNSAKSFFEKYDNVVKQNKDRGYKYIIQNLAEEKMNFSIAFDHSGRSIHASPGEETVISSIMPDASFNALIRNNLIAEKYEFRIDNFNTFLKEVSSETIPTIIYFKIYENPNIILGCVKSSNLTSVRIRYIERMNGRDVVNYIILYIVVFFIFFSFAYLVILFLIRKTFLLPISIISEQIRNVIDGNYKKRIKVTAGDEIGNLGSSFNTMSEKIHYTLAELKREIIEREKAERLLSEEKEELKVTLKSIGDGVITTDKEGNVVLINYVAENLTGWSQQEAQGRKLEEIFQIINEKTRKKVSNPISKVISQGKTIGLANHTVLISKSGSEIMIDDSAAPICGSNNEILGAVLVFRDVTEARKMEENHLRAIKLESIGFLAGGIAHDFNNILTTILGNISFAKRIIKGENKACEMIEDAEKAAYRAKDLSNQLLSLSKGGSPVTSVASIKELIKEASEFALHGTNIGCEYAIDNNIWNAVCDQGQIIQVIHNLVINARQAMPNGGKISITCSNFNLTKLQDGLPLAIGAYLQICVRDTGIGIEHENLMKIFDPYFTTKPEGQGIGLTTTYSIIKKHNGYIEVQSELNKGTSFTFYLPATQESTNNIRKQVQDYTGKRLKVLILEDDTAIIKALTSFFNLSGHFADFTDDGKVTVEKFSKAEADNNPYDLVILDLTIKNGMGGKETMSELLRINTQIKAVVSSGYSNDSVIAHYKDYGFTARLSKPYTSDDINALLNEIFSKDTKNTA